MASTTLWRWVWVNSGSWWWTGKPDCCSPWGRKELDTLSDWTELIFNFMRNFLMVFHSGSINLHFQQCIRALFSPHSCQHFLFLVFLISHYNMRWYFIMILSFIPTALIMLSIFTCIFSSSAHLLQKIFYSDHWFLIGLYVVCANIEMNPCHNSLNSMFWSLQKQIYHSGLQCSGLTLTTW